LSKFLPRLIWILVAIVLVVGIAKLLIARPTRSEDQKILLDKSKQ